MRRDFLRLRATINYLCLISMLGLFTIQPLPAMSRVASVMRPQSTSDNGRPKRKRSGKAGKGGTGKIAGGKRVKKKREVQSPAKPPERDYTETINGVRLEMVRIQAGTFPMGSPISSSTQMFFEWPRHPVTVQAFDMGKYEVTQEQWMAVMGELPLEVIRFAALRGDNMPVVDVTWKEAIEFCQKLSNVTGRAYRLPTEAEWEYACRATTETRYSFGDTVTAEQANFDASQQYAYAVKGEFRNRPTPVGSFPPNRFGLYDMHGNVFEWCQSQGWRYPYKSNDGRESLTGDAGRVVRGGSWANDGSYLRSAYRMELAPSEQNRQLGFRVVAAPRT